MVAPALPNRKPSNPKPPNSNQPAAEESLRRGILLALATVENSVALLRGLVELQLATAKGIHHGGAEEEEVSGIGD